MAKERRDSLTFERLMNEVEARVPVGQSNISMPGGMMIEESSEAVKAERDALRRKIEALKAALREALDGWDDAVSEWPDHPLKLRITELRKQFLDI